MALIDENDPLGLFKNNDPLGLLGVEGLPEKRARGDFSRGLGNYLPQMKEMAGAIQTIAGVGAKKIGADGIGDNLVAGGLERMKGAKSKIDSRDTDEFTGALNKGIGSVVTDWLPYQAGQAVGNLGEAALAAAGGALVGGAASGGIGAIPGAAGGALAKSVVKKAVIDKAKDIAKDQGEDKAQAYLMKEAGKRIGATTGIAGMAGYHGAGEVGGRMLDEMQKSGTPVEQFDFGRFAPAAAGHAGLEFIGDKIALGAFKPFGQEARLGIGGFVKDVAERGVKTGLKEAPTEVGQTGFERFGAELPLTDADAMKEYLNAGAAGFGMGLTTGGAGGAYHNITGNPAKQQDTPAQEPPPSEEPPLSGPLTNPAATGTPSDQIVTADVARANEVAAAQTNADAIYGAREAFEVEQAKAKLGGGAIGRAAAAGIDSGVIAPAQVTAQPVQGATNGAAGSGTTELAQTGGQGASNQPARGVPDAVAQPASGGGVDAAAGGTAPGGAQNLAAGTADTRNAIGQNIAKPEQVAVQSGQTQGTKPQAQPEQQPAADTAGGLSVGTTPKNAEPVTVRDGVVYQGNYAAVNAETGEPVTVPEGANRLAIAKALRDAGALSNRQKIYGLDKAQGKSEIKGPGSPEAAPGLEVKGQDNTEAAPVQEPATKPEQREAGQEQAPQESDAVAETPGIPADRIPRALKITLEKTADGKTRKKQVNARKAYLAATQNANKYEALLRCLG